MRNFQLPGRSPVYASNGMVATSHPLAASEALDTLKSGGNAMDAAIAGAFLLGICEPHSTGIGGDLFALWSPAGSDDVLAMNGSGRAPAGLNAASLRAQGLTEIDPKSGHAVTMPGAVDAFCRLSANYGKLGLDRCLAPAIKYAEDGVPVAPRVARDWNAELGRLDQTALGIYSHGGVAPKVGDMFRAPKMANAFRKIAAGGRDAFYSGEIADDMLCALQAAGGTHTAVDFDKVSASEPDPISGTYKDIEVLEHPPNGQGATALLILNILKHFDLGALDPFGTTRAHIEAEATKLAYGMRNACVADSEYALTEAMLSAETAADLAAKIQLTDAIAPTAPILGQPHKDTVYITVVDRDGMAVSLIYSTFHSFGSGITSPEFGIIMQNRGCGFTLEEGNPNEAGPRKRPLHTIIPAMVREARKVVMPFGVMGGQYQAVGHARFITNLKDFGMDLQEAIDGPRCFWDNGVLKVEHGYDENVRSELADLGHEVVVPDPPIGGAQAIKIDHSRGVLIAGSDPRKDGAAVGY